MKLLTGAIFGYWQHGLCSSAVFSDVVHFWYVVTLVVTSNIQKYFVQGIFLHAYRNWHAGDKNAWD
jgi:hypothetical protein